MDKKIEIDGHTFTLEFSFDRFENLSGKIVDLGYSTAAKYGGKTFYSNAYKEGLYIKKERVETIAQREYEAATAAFKNTILPILNFQKP